MPPPEGVAHVVAAHTSRIAQVLRPALFSLALPFPVSPFGKRVSHSFPSRRLGFAPVTDDRAPCACRGTNLFSTKLLHTQPTDGLGLAR